MTSEDLPTQTFRFEVVHNSMLTPILLAMAIDSVLTTLEKRAGERTIVWKSAIETADRTVRWDSVFSGPDGARRGGRRRWRCSRITSWPTNFTTSRSAGVEVEIAHSDRLQSARIVHVEAQKERVRPGDDGARSGSTSRTSAGARGGSS